MTSPGLVEGYFRHEYGRLVAVLVRQAGARHIEAIEDAVQSALMAALQSWRSGAPPDNPSAWLYRVARNHLIGDLRQQSRRADLLARFAADREAGIDDAEPHFANEVSDDLLRMLFLCCDDAIPGPSRLVLALKTLCGFDTREIAHRLFTSEANVYKRLTRARDVLRERPVDPDTLHLEQVESRLPSVRAVLYLLFTEGYLSVHGDAAIRRELCDEAIRLATLLAEHPLGQSPESSALLALLHLHAARMTSRQDGSGGLLLLEEQDRAQWDARQIEVGLAWLARSAEGDVFSRYHAEAGIAAEHCIAPSFAQTRWDRIVECYEMLERSAPSALHKLNRAVAVAEWHGPAAGLAVLDGFAPPGWLAGSYLWAAVLADLHRRAGNTQAATNYHTLACDAAPTPQIRALIARRLGADLTPAADSGTGARFGVRTSPPGPGIAGNDPRTAPPGHAPRD